MFKGKIIAIDTPRNMKKAFKSAVLEAHPQDAAAFVDFIKDRPGISDWQQLGDRFHVVAAGEAEANEIIAAAGKSANLRRIAASVEDVFVEKIK
jgi:hypothetical protein